MSRPSWPRFLSAHAPRGALSVVVMVAASCSPPATEGEARPAGPWAEKESRVSPWGSHVPGDGGPADAGWPADATVDVGAAPEAGDAGPAGVWHPLAHPPPFTPDAPLLLTDGTVMVHGLDDLTTWFLLTPDKTGNYLKGQWSQLAPMPTGYAPLYFASAVMPNGSVVIAGGEYNRDTDVDVAQGALYDPVAGTWTPITTPSGWSAVGDASSVVLPDGTLMIASTATKDQALLDLRTLTWTMTGAGKRDANSEEGWTLLPNGKVLTIDVGFEEPEGGVVGSHAELYDPVTGKWSSAGSTGVVLHAQGEIGPAILMPSGDVFATGADRHTAIYQASGTWKAGPDFPKTKKGQLDIADGPAVLLPNGHVLCAASPGDYETGTVFFEFDGAALNEVAGTPGASSTSSYNIYMLVLPSGEVLAVDRTSDVEVFTPAGAPDPAWAPTITTCASTLARGSTNPIAGTQFNGLSQAVAYGDDYQAATNYPLVRITNIATGHVAYARTHDHSTMAVATGAQTVSTFFDVPKNAETGASELVVVANGIASAPVAVSLK